MTDTATDRTLVPTTGDARPRRGGRREHGHCRRRVKYAKGLSRKAGGVQNRGLALTGKRQAPGDVVIPRRIDGINHAAGRICIVHKIVILPVILECSSLRVVRRRH